MAAGTPHSANAFGRVGIMAREKHPRAATCPRHLRRICGTCQHFTGTLRGKGDCTHYSAPTDSGVSAHDCTHWVRRSAADGDA